MVNIKNLVDKYKIDIVFIKLNKRACFEPKYGIIFVNQSLTKKEQEESIYHEFKHVKDHVDIMPLYKIPIFRSKMEAEAECYMFECLIENNDGQFNYSNVITHYNLKMGQETYLI
ncbi:ImmA/IrrE family metallo-endopeptidase [Enterococcus sp. DIV1420a]|uniref:ImmA/IrrE family metallo-endopeptidase n=1 Tax=Enterococcus sp. DIV1420a TaxID=2774672 RepID=UPI003F26E2BA